MNHIGSAIDKERKKKKKILDDSFLWFMYNQHLDWRVWIVLLPPASPPPLTGPTKQEILCGRTWNFLFQIYISWQGGAERIRKRKGRSRRGVRGEGGRVSRFRSVDHVSSYLLPCHAIALVSATLCQEVCVFISHSPHPQSYHHYATINTHLTLLNWVSISRCSAFDFFVNACYFWSFWIGLCSSFYIFLFLPRLFGDTFFCSVEIFCYEV